jgi:glyoxylase I family protein
MKINFIDHIVLIVKNIRETEKFYSSFLGDPVYINDESVVYQTGNTKIFFVLPEREFEKTDKENGGLNHIAFGVRSLDELKLFGTALDQASIQHSGIKTDKYGNKEFIWFDDPSNIRIEIYCRPLD